MMSLFNKLGHPKVESSSLIFLAWVLRALTEAFFLCPTLSSLHRPVDGSSSDVLLADCKFESHHIPTSL